MALNPSIILAGQGPQPINALAQGVQAGQQTMQAQRRNALNAALEQYGPGARQGNEEALNALARFDPNMSLGIQESRLGMDATRHGMAATDRRLDQSDRQLSQADTRLGMDRERLDMAGQEQATRLRILGAQEARAAEEHMLQMDETERAIDLDKDKRAVAQLYQTQSPEEWDALAERLGQPEFKGQFENRDRVLLQMQDLETIYSSLQPAKPQSPEGKLNADIQAGYVDPSAAGPDMYVQVTGDEAEARNLDPNKVWQISPDNKVSEVGGSGQTINVSTGGGSDFYEALDKAQGDMFATLIDQGTTVPQKLAQIDDLDRILSNQSTPEGFEAAFKNFAGNYGIDSEGLSSLQAANAIISRLVPEQRPPGSGEMSDADLALFKQSLPRLINTREGNQIIMDSLRGIAMYERQQAEIAAQVANRELTPAEGREALSALENPLQRFRRSGDTRIGGENLIDPETQALIDRLADG